MMQLRWHMCLRPATVLDMTHIDAPGRLISLEMADEHIKEMREDQITQEEKIDSVLRVLALMVYDTTEADLREWLTLGGIDLRKSEQFDRAQDMTSLFVAAGALEINDLFSFSLVTLGTSMVERYQWDDELRAQMEKIKTDSKFFRDVIAPNVVS